MKPRHFCFTVIIICVQLFGTSASAESKDEAELLVSQALEKHLDQERFWHLLLHYKKTMFGAYESEEDGPAFFNAPDGKYNPASELAATLRSFFRSPSDLKPGEDHPQCNFAARYKWLKARLTFDPARLPERRCDRLQEWKEDLDPERITLIFAAYYMNNPASMFGHTLLRIDKKQRGPGRALLAKGINYAANADTTNPLVYTFMGLFGGFKGVVSIFPYYVKVQEYNNFENRDLWEYELNFSEDQIDYFVLHLWELGGNYFDYYYFQENCSYHILSLLEVANPDLHLTDGFLFQVIPADTVKAVVSQPGLVARRVYRPSLLSQMNDKRLRLNGVQTQIFRRMVDDPQAMEGEDYRGLSEGDKALVLDTALDYAQYRSMAKEKTASVIDKETRKILLERSRLPVRPEKLQKPVQFSTPPDSGHGSARIRIGAGSNEDESFEEFSIRPAYHDLLAKDTGYSRDSQILFLELTGRRYNESKITRLDRMSLIDIVSLTPYDPLFRKKSWRLGIGVDTLRDRDCDYCNAFKLSYGVGYSYKPGFFSPLLVYGLADAELEASRRLTPGHYRLGGGATAGALIDFSSNWRLQLAADYLSFPLGEESHHYKLSANQRYALGQNLDLRLELGALSGRREGTFTFNYYF